MRVAVFAALPQELEPLVRKLKAVRGVGSHSYDIYLAADSSRQILLVRTGMGIANAADAVQHVCSEYKPDVVVSIGYGGALYAGAVGGEIVFGSEFFSLDEADAGITLKTPPDEEVFGSMSAGLAVKIGAIVTLPCLMLKKEILRKLPTSVTNPVCDMETYAYAGFCAANGIRFFALRGITDLAHQDITSDIAGIADESGKPDIVRAIKTVLRKPGIIPDLITLGIYSHRASGNLRAATLALLEALH